MIDNLQYLIDIYYDNTLDEALISTDDEDREFRVDGRYVLKSTEDAFTYAYFIDPDVVAFVDIMKQFPSEIDINELIFGFLKKISDNLAGGQPFDEIIFIADNFMDFLNFFGIPVESEDLQDSLISICNGREDIVQFALTKFSKDTNEDGKAIDKLAAIDKFATIMRDALDEQSKIPPTEFDPTGYDGAAFYYITDNPIQEDDYDTPEYQEQPPALPIVVAQGIEANLEQTSGPSLPPTHGHDESYSAQPHAFTIGVAPRIDAALETNPFARRGDFTRQPTLDPSAFTFPQQNQGPSLFNEPPEYSGLIEDERLGPSAFYDEQKETQDPFYGPPQTEEKAGYPQLARSFSDNARKTNRANKTLVFDGEDEKDAEEDARKLPKKSRSAESSPRDFPQSFQPSFNLFPGGKRTRKYRRKPKKTLKRRKNKKTRKPKRKPRKTLKKRRRI